MAQQPDEQQQPGGKKKKEAAEQTHAAGAKPGAGANAEKKTPETGAKNREAGARNERGGMKGQKAERKGNKAEEATTTSPERSGQTEATTGASPTGKHPAAEQGRKGRKERNANERNANAENPNANASASPATGAAASVTPAAGATAAAGAAQSGAGANQANRVAGRGGAGKKVEPQQVQQIKQQHASFRAQPRPDRAPAVTFNPGYRIEGAERWQGPQFEVFRSYHPERHDQGWYRSHYNRVELIGGGYYYWNNGYWYPAWGYDPRAEYYAYDGPIYVGHRAEPPDQVIADVQTELQQMGYYQGEVDGLLGPLTRQALTAYQTDQGLTVTAVIDEPTLDALQLG